MFTVVEDDQQTLVMQTLCQRIVGRIGSAHQTERNGQPVRQQRRVGECRQFGQPDSVGIGVQHVRGGLYRQARLTGARAACDGQQTCGAQQALYLRQLLLSSDKCRQLCRQVIWMFVGGGG